jgi:hypothetical protein
MIRPQAHNDQPGVIGQQHGLHRLTETLEALTQGQTAQQQHERQMQERLTTLTQQLATLTTVSKRLARTLTVLAVLTLGLGGLMGWQITHRPDMAYAHALGALDSVLVQTWSSLPKHVQESLSITYGRRGWTSPGDRQGARQ